MNTEALPRAGLAGLASGERLALAVLLFGLAALAGPALWDLVSTVWASDEQGHGPVILLVAMWLVWRRRAALLALPDAPAPIAGGLLLALALGVSVLGRGLEIVQFEVGAIIVGAAAVLLLLRGWAGLRMAAFPLAMLLFIVPLPGVFVQTLTVPLKTGVSYAAEALMHALGYPIARTGVIIVIGQYHLLVADACAGLTSMFTLECLGLVYLNLMGYTSRWRNITLAILLVPIAFFANVVRVVILVLVTYHFGDAAGQGFVHGFAGIVLFAAATLMMFATDRALDLVFSRAAAAPAAPAMQAPAGARLPLAAATVAAVLCVAALPAAEWMRPTQRTSDLHGAIDLAAQVPARFGEWREDKTLVPLLPDPQLQATLDATYSQVLARTYVNTRGQRVMLSVAYGNDQNSEATAVHRPEFCYQSQGFKVQGAGVDTVALAGGQVEVQRLLAQLDGRFEPISYWITLDRTATLPGLGRKLQQMRYGLRGEIADGMVVRVSTVGVPQAQSFALQDGFVAQLHAAMPEALRARYFGS
jgi:exosortase B